MANWFTNQKAKRLIGIMPIENDMHRDGPKNMQTALAGKDPAQNPAGGMPMYGEEKPGGPPMMSKGPHVEKDEFGNEIPKGFKSDMGALNPTITSTTKVNKNQRPMTDGSNEPFSVGDVIKTNSDGKRTTSTIVGSKLNNSELSKPSHMRNKKNLKSQEIKHRTESYSS